MTWALLVSSRDTNSILEYSAATGAFLRAIVPPGSGGIASPGRVLVGPSGDLFVASDEASPATTRVLRYDGLTGDSVGGFVASNASNISALAFGPNGNLFAIDEIARVVREYDQDSGGPVRTLPLLVGNGCCARDLVFGPSGNLFVAMTTSVEEFDRLTGAFVKSFAHAPDLAPGAMAFGPDRLLYVGLRPASSDTTQCQER